MKFVPRRKYVCKYVREAYGVRPGTRGFPELTDAQVNFSTSRLRNPPMVNFSTSPKKSFMI